MTAFAHRIESEHELLSVEMVEMLVTRQGFRREFSRDTLIWQVVVYARG